MTSKNFSYYLHCENQLVVVYVVASCILLILITDGKGKYWTLEKCLVLIKTKKYSKFFNNYMILRSCTITITIQN